MSPEKPETAKITNRRFPTLLRDSLDGRDTAHLASIAVRSRRDIRSRRPGAAQDTTERNESNGEIGVVVLLPYVSERVRRKVFGTDISSISSKIVTYFSCWAIIRTVARDVPERGTSRDIKMLMGKKIVVVLPAYNAAKTLEKTYRDIPLDLVDEVLLVDDASGDDTAAEAIRLGISTVVHERNRGYGGNQKSCYRAALELGADIVVMLHPDYQYTPKLLPAMAAMIASGEFDVVLASRILGTGALKGGMPRYKYVANRFLTLVENIFLGQKLSEYHTGYRAFSRQVLQTIPLEENSDDFVFDNQILAQVIWFDFRIGEISCPTKYFDDASSITFRRCVTYGFGVLQTSLLYRLQKWGVVDSRLFRAGG